MIAAEVIPMRRFGTVMVVLALAAASVGCGDDDDVTSDTSTSSTETSVTTDTTPSTDTGPSSSGTVATTAPESTAPPGGDLTTAVWPTEASGLSYDDPVAAAEGFAVDFVGFVDPVVGEFQQGDSRSGEVEVRPTADGPVTTVLVRQLDASDSWWVLGAATANIQIESPSALEAISSPVPLRGTSTAFEATVQTEVRDDDGQTLGEGFVMGGSMGEMGPFDGELSFTAPATGYGALVLSTVSMENGQVWEAAVLRVAFA
jgi:hypothetical protein